jgi:hypothetical protein
MKSQDNRNDKYLNLIEVATNEGIEAKTGTLCCPGGVDLLCRSVLKSGSGIEKTGLCGKQLRKEIHER